MLGTAKRAAQAVAGRAARRYVPGPELADALRARDAAAGRGLASTVGYWNTRDDDPGVVEERNLRAIAALGGVPDAEVSLKLPALGDDPARLERLSAAARHAGVRLHADALAPDTQDAVLERALGAGLGVTLPGRWARSVRDADRAIEAAVQVRVVKGQWADGSVPDDVIGAGYLTVVERLAGRVPTLAVATHHPSLALAALERVRGAGASFELQLLYGLPARAVEAAVGDQAERTRLYVPYGAGFLPYAVRTAWRNPRMVARLGADILGINAS